MKMPVRTIVWLAFGLLAFLVFVDPVAAQSPGARGVIVINDGKRTREFSRIAECRKVETFGRTYRAEMTNGEVSSGLIGHVLYWIDYSDRDAAKMLRKLGAEFPQWSQFAESKARELGGDDPPPEGGGPSGGSGTNVLDRLELDGTVYTGVKPTSMKDGMIGLIHDGGALRLPADLLSHQSLQRLSRVGPGLRTSPGFGDLMGSFEPTVLAGGKVLSGVRLNRRDGDQVFLTSDEGDFRVGVDEMSADMLDRVTQAGERYEEWKQDLKEERERHLEKLRLENELAFEREKARIEQNLEQAKFWWSVGRGVVNRAFSSD